MMKKLLKRIRCAFFAEHQHQHDLDYQIKTDLETNIMEGFSICKKCGKKKIIYSFGLPSFPKAEDLAKEQQHDDPMDIEYKEEK